jgi:hypothetical protein
MKGPASRDQWGASEAAGTDWRGRLRGQAHAFGRLDDLHPVAFGREQASDEHAPALLLLVHGGSRRDDGADACYARQTESAGCFV